MNPSLLEIGETGHALRRAFDRRAATLGVTRAQWRVLAKVSRHPDLRQVELADLLDIEAITLCRIVDRLEDAGLIERQRDPSDRRAWRLHLTPAARPIVTQLTALATELAGEAFDGIAGEDIDTMRRVLARVRDNVAALQPIKKASGQ